METIKTESDFLKTVFVLDVETSGIDPLENGILSIGAVSLINPKIQFYKECHCQGAKINKKALEYNGFTEKDCKNREKPSEKEICAELLNWVKENNFTTLAGHNISFDKEFLNIRGGIPRSLDIFRNMLDLACLSSFIFLDRLRSFDICERLDVPQEPIPHNALHGALAERRCLIKLFSCETGKNFSLTVLKNNDMLDEQKK